jgi:hypothetical protein
VVVVLAMVPLLVLVLMVVVLGEVVVVQAAVVEQKVGWKVILEVRSEEGLLEEWEVWGVVLQKYRWRS